jgi:predicted RNase H-like HicB family nuclease
MSTAELDCGRGTEAKRPEAEWTNLKGKNTFECRAVFCPEEEGGFSAHCINLAGVVSQGDTLPEAIENIADAFRETILYYQSVNAAIPWSEVDVDRPKGTHERWILVKCGR